MNDGRLGARIPRDLIDQFDAAATLDRRSRSDAVRVAMEQYVNFVAARVDGDAMFKTTTLRPEAASRSGRSVADHDRTREVIG
jgi:metal-responsive CopG/Arc/MetJ family transcriptional regulator